MRSRSFESLGLGLACLALGACGVLSPVGDDQVAPTEPVAVSADQFPAKRDEWVRRVEALGPYYEVRAASAADPEQAVVLRRLVELSELAVALGSAAENFEAFERVRGGQVGFLSALDALSRRLREQDQPESRLDPIFEFRSAEDRIYRDTLYAEARQDFEIDNERRLQLLERKYFHDPEDDGGNFLEGLLNSSLALTETYQIGDPGWRTSPRAEGVSPWEAVARIEPVYSFADETELGAVAAIGLTRHFFPEFEGASATVKETPLSEWVKRAGVRIGAGVLDHPGESPDFATGAAIQLGSFSVWGLYNFEEDDFSVAIGAADFGFVKDLLPVF